MICIVKPIVCTHHQAATQSTTIPEPDSTASYPSAVLVPQFAVDEFNPYLYLSSDLSTL